MATTTSTASGNGARHLQALLAGAAVGTLGGLIGLGGAEFRLPLLIGLFGFAALAAVIMNKAMSLIVVASALVFRARAVPLEQVLAHWPIVVNLLAGSLLGAWWGASWATRAHPRTLYRVIAGLLIVIAAALVLHYWLPSRGVALTEGHAQIVAGVLAGLGIGVVASLLGVAGGELLIPTIVLLFAVDIKLAGSLSLAVSLPTMVVGFARYSRDGSFRVLRENRSFLVAMAGGSLVGSLVGASLLGIVPSTWLVPALALVLVASAWKVWQHQ
jgi:uncharacterized membrane protein YfcA